MKRLIIAIAVCVAWLGAAAQRGTVRSDTMYSETLGTEKPYSIYLPAGYDIRCCICCMAPTATIPTGSRSPA